MVSHSCVFRSSGLFCALCLPLQGQFSCGLMGAAAADYIKQHAASMAGKSPSSEAVEELDRETGQDDASPMFMYLAIQGIHSSNNRWVQSPQAELDKMDSISPHLTCGEAPIMPPKLQLFQRLSMA